MPLPALLALQVFYGTIPLIVVVLALWFRRKASARNTAERLAKLEAAVDHLQIQKRLDEAPSATPERRKTARTGY